MMTQIGCLTAHTTRNRERPGRGKMAIMPGAPIK